MGECCRAALDEDAARAGQRARGVERSQRERLFGAMVAISSEKGYEATKIADLVEDGRRLAGRLLRPLQGQAGVPAGRRRRPGRADDRADRAGRGRADRRGPGPPGGGSVPRPRRRPAGGLEDGASSRSTRPGRRAKRRSSGSLDTFERFGVEQLNQIPGRKGMPPQMVRAMLGGLPEGDPEAPLQRRSRPAAAAGRGRSPTGASPTPRPRARSRRRDGAGARRGPSTSARRSPTRRSGCCGRWRRSSPRRATRRRRSPRSSSGPATSQRVFYGHFESKEEAFLAALDSGSAQMLGTVLPAFRRAQELGGVGAGGLRGDVRLRDRRARVHAARRGRDVHGRQTGAADARHA